MVFLVTLFLLAFIPLYPKLPTIHINHTWVYIRLEDFFVTATIAIWILQLIRKKATTQTPLTIPILIFWLIGGISTVFAIVFLFPTLSDVFPSVAILHYLRRIEYLALFFVAFSGIRNKKFVPYIAFVLSVTLLLVVGYGIGQRLYPNIFVAYSTMNEEFAKGIPLQLSKLGRIQSTFAGHYDLAAYLAMMIPIMGSMVFGFRKLAAKLFFLFSTVAGLVLLLMTASRVSFGVYLIAISFMLALQKKKILIIPVILASIILLMNFSGISDRFSSTISQVDVVVDARTGKSIGVAKNLPNANDTAKKQGAVVEDVQSSGENLPRGSGYINLPSQQQGKTASQVLYTKLSTKKGTSFAETTNLQGDFVVKKVLAYDVSFTTRFEGEWPRAIDAFKRNILLGSGYSSISLATDSDYLRTLGETGILGLLSFLFIFVILVITIVKLLPEVSDKTSKSLVIGITAGLLGVLLNAFLIDVFEASKVAFPLWMLIGLALGLLVLYQKTQIDYKKEVKVLLVSFPAISLYLLVATFIVFFPMIHNYFVGDDFTWLRWAADCKKIVALNGLQSCESIPTTLLHYFTQSDGFFYRPGTKVYFFFMYSLFGLNPTGYHLFSLLAHFATTVFVFLIGKKLLKNTFYAAVSALLFLVLSIHFESIFWISVTGSLVASMLSLAAVYFFIVWRETKKWPYGIFSLLASICSLFFHEFGIITPLLIICFDVVTQYKGIKNLFKKWYYYLYLPPIPLYLLVRFLAKSHWFNGDYSYSFSNLFYNVFGNSFGYLFISLFGISVLPQYERLRIIAKDNKTVTLFVVALAIVILGLLIWKAFSKIKKEKRKVIILSALFFFVSLLPFLGLGNIAPRYVYLPSVGLVFALCFLLSEVQSSLAILSKKGAYLLVGIFLVVMIVFNISEINRINKDWQKASDISRKLLNTLFDAFGSGENLQNSKLYFVNVPIKTGDAWVFPVGLFDAVWFSTQNKNVTMYSVPTVETALSSVQSFRNSRIFLFQKDGTLKEIIQTNKSQLQKIK